MKFLAALSFMGLMSCAAPKYVYDFGQPASASHPAPEVPAHASDLVSSKVELGTMTASTDISSGPLTMEKKREPRVIVSPNKPAINKVKPEKAKPSKQVRFEGNLKRATFFVAGGLLLLLLGTDALVVMGWLCILIGIIFGIKWLLNDL